MTEYDVAPGEPTGLLHIEDDFGTMIAADEFSRSNFRGLQSVTMHETGPLGAGWADDTPIPWFGFACPKCFEVYSGDVDGDIFDPDETPEELRNSVVRWSIMRAGPADNFASGPLPRLTFSIEELSTVDFDHVPSRDE